MPYKLVSRQDSNMQPPAKAYTLKNTWRLEISMFRLMVKFVSFFKNVYV